MPQEFHVLRCFSCDTFQVHIVKKAKKWECKVCGSKQSFKQNYGKGTAKDCRAHVMKLNKLRYMKDNVEILNEDVEASDETPSEVPTEYLMCELNEEDLTKKQPVVSKWAQYLDEPSEDEGDCLDEIIKQKIKQNIKKLGESNRKKICNENDSLESKGEKRGFQAIEKDFKNPKESKYSRFLDNDLPHHISKYSKMTDPDLSFLDDDLNF